MILSIVMLASSIAIILFNIKRGIKYNVFLNSIFNFSLLLLGYSTFIFFSQLSFKYKLQTLAIFAPGFGFIFASIILFLIALSFKAQIKLKKFLKIKFFTYLVFISTILGLILKFYILINFALILFSYVIFWLLVNKIIYKENSKLSTF